MVKAFLWDTGNSVGKIYYTTKFLPWLSSSLSLLSSSSSWSSYRGDDGSHKAHSFSCIQTHTTLSYHDRWDNVHLHNTCIYVYIYIKLYVYMSIEVWISIYVCMYTCICKQARTTLSHHDRWDVCIHE
jgi:hypothetical protein